jgi:uncharacterized membrane protein YeaQ/YmgE (transglycosylase-associated protein family)
MFWYIVVWMVFGGLAGWVASLLVGKDSQLGLVGNIVVGIVGAFIGGFLFPNDADTFDFGSFVAAVVGAVILLVLVSLVTRNNPRPRI